MASKSTIIRITHPKNNVNGWRLDHAAHEAREEAIRIADLFEGIAAGCEPCSFEVQVASTALVRASATLTCASIDAADTFTIGKTQFTAIANGGSPTAVQFAIGTGGTEDDDTAAAIAAAVNANTTTNKIVRASAALHVVTFTALNPGVLGNYIVLTSSNGSRAAVTGSGYLASGAGDDAAGTTYSRS